MILMKVKDDCKNKIWNLDLLDIIECEIELKPSLEQQDLHPHQPDFLLPVHIRQQDQSPQDNIIPLLNQWKLIESNDDISPNHLQEFHRICPKDDNNQTDLPQFQCKFIPIPSNERQMELFQQYTNDDLSSYAQSVVDWQLMFQHLQDYRKKAIEQSEFFI